MKQRIRWIYSLLIAVLLCIASMRTPFAEESAFVLDLPITVRVHGGTTGSSPTIEFELISTNDAPMPIGTDDDVYRFVVKGSGTVTVRFSFTETGTFEYELSGKTDAGSLTPDKLYITIRVYEENGALTAAVVAEGADGKKCELDFAVEITPPAPPPPQTGDDSHLALYVAIAGISLILIVILAVYLICNATRRKRR